MEEKGLIMQLQHFSVHDGDGIRTTIFMAGCPLRCRWCANPESWGNEELMDPDSQKPLRRWMSLEEIVREIRRQRIFYRHSGGGITYSGGEPTVQLDFLRRMTEAFYAMGIHQTMETCGHFSWKDTQDALKKMDALFVDLKVLNPQKHEELTGCSNHLILENIRKIGKLNIPVVIRIPLIPGINDSEENLQSTAHFVREAIPEGKVEILPYHQLGLEKYKKLGISGKMHLYRIPEAFEIKQARNIVEACGVKTISY